MEKSNFIYGYKAFHKNPQEDGTYKLICRDKEYKMGFNEEVCTPCVCSHGLHFCEDILALSSYYSVPCKDVAVYPVIAVGNVDRSGDKCATDKLYIIDQEITYDMLTSIYHRGLKAVFNDLVSVRYPATNEVDAYLLDNNQEAEVVYGGIHLLVKQLPALMEYKNSLTPFESDLCKTYFDITGKPLTFENLINHKIRTASPDEVLDFMGCVSGGLKRTVALNKYTRHYGYYCSNNGFWYYIEDLKKGME